jgi:hypothetical protein
MAPTSTPTPDRRETPLHPPRLWTVAEANARLDSLRELLPQLKAWVVRLSEVHDGLERLQQFWGKEVDALDSPDRALKMRLEDEWKRLGARLENEVLALHREGIELKDLETGLVDFYCLRAGEVVYLCWQRGETEVGHWHALSGGFRSRRPLDARSDRERPSTARASRGA